MAQEKHLEGGGSPSAARGPESAEEQGCTYSLPDLMGHVQTSSYSWKHVGKQVGCAAIPVTKAEDVDSKDDEGRWGAAGHLCADGQTSSLDLLIPYLW